MFGMSSIDFWENDPQLYWAYRFSFIKNNETKNEIEKEKMQFNCWLQGKINSIAFGVALNNSLSKTPKDFPSYEEIFNNKKTKNEKIYNDLADLLEGIEDKELRQQIEFNYWARL